MPTPADAPRPQLAAESRHAADSHDLIRVRGARVNNLKNISVDIPKRRLTVFTGVSGSGKSSLVFGTIATESQRLINETYTAFVQSCMPSLGRPDVDGAERRDHRRPGADGGQLPLGTWLLENSHPSAVHFALEDGDGRPSRWNTLRALRVLRWYESIRQPAST